MKSPQSYFAMVKILHCILTLKELKPDKENALNEVLCVLAYWLNFSNIIMAYSAYKILQAPQKTTKNLQKSCLYIHDMVKEIFELYQEVTQFLEPANLSKFVDDGTKFAEHVVEMMNSDEKLKNKVTINFNTKK